MLFSYNKIKYFIETYGKVGINYKIGIPGEQLQYVLVCLQSLYYILISSIKFKKFTTNISKAN